MRMENVNQTHFSQKIFNLCQRCNGFVITNLLFMADSPFSAAVSLIV